MAEENPNRAPNGNISTENAKQKVKQAERLNDDPLLYAMKTMEDIRNRGKVERAFSKQEKQNRKLRKRLCTAVLWFLAFEVVAGIVAFYLIGAGVLKYDQQWMVDTFFLGMFGQVFGTGNLVFKNLFPSKDDDAGPRVKPKDFTN